jgi:tetratricopeptide (TPR) repeat protein
MLWMLLSLVIGVSCTRNVSLTRLAPAEISIPSHVQRLLIVDRTEPESQGFAIIEGILTGEAPFEVKNAIEATLATIQQELNTSPRYEVIRARERLKGGFFSQTFPQPLMWSQIERLCASYEADAVLALEKFSSDFIVTDKKALIKKTVGTGKEAKVIEVDGIYAEGVASVQVGFRFYDPANRNIADQIDFNKTNLWSAEAETRTQALALMIDKVRATQVVGQMAGASYARRVAPMYLTVSRSFFPKSKTNPTLGHGARLAEVNQWEQAIDTWIKGLELPNNDKTAGRLAYNIAIGYEVLGNLALAQEWAGKSYTSYGFKKGRSYAGSLTQQIMADELVRRQLAVE